MSPKPPYERISPNQVVAANLRRARELRGWTQEEAAAHLEPHLGERWTKATFSAAERSTEGKRIRQFDADEIVAFSEGFSLPIGWFFMPTETEVYRERPDATRTEVEAAEKTGDWGDVVEEADVLISNDPDNDRDFDNETDLPPDRMLHLIFASHPDLERRFETLIRRMPTPAAHRLLEFRGGHHLDQYVRHVIKHLRGSVDGLRRFVEVLELPPEAFEQQVTRDWALPEEEGF